MHAWYGQRSKDTGTCNALRLCWLGLRTRSCEIPNLRGLSILPPALAISPQIDVFYGDSIVLALLAWRDCRVHDNRVSPRLATRTPAASHSALAGPGLPYPAW